MMKHLITFIFCGILLSVTSMSLSAGNGREYKPAWMKKAPLSPRSDVEFVPVSVRSTDALALNAKALGALADKLPSTWNVSQHVSAEDDDKFLSSLNDGQSGTSIQTGKITVNADGERKKLNCALVDEYSIVRDGIIYYDALYQVTRGEGVPFLETYLTNKYGAKGCLLSIVPGLGQFSKGDPLKGGLFLGGCAAGAVGVVITESQRQAYISQMSQIHDANILRQLDARQKNMGIARNVCIGATAAIYLWNLIDAAVAPGARRVVITGNSIQYNF